MSLEDKIAFLRESRHAFGRTALVLSGGGSFGAFHMGIVKALLEANLLPRVVSGSSAGAIGAEGGAAHVPQGGTAAVPGCDARSAAKGMGLQPSAVPWCAVLTPLHHDRTQPHPTHTLPPRSVGHPVHPDRGRAGRAV